MQNGYMKVNRFQTTFVILKKTISYKRQCVYSNKNQKGGSDIMHDSTLITQEDLL